MFLLSLFVEPSDTSLALSTSPSQFTHLFKNDLIHGFCVVIAASLYPMFSLTFQCEQNN